MRDPVVGDTLDQYRLLELVARSGMASIFKAVDLDTNGMVALKIPHVQYESDIVFSERFRREQEVGQTLHHANIVQVLTPRHQSRIYLVMEFVEGRSLRAIMKSKEPIATPLALSIARQVTSALQYLHDEGVVHRDIKPENILLVEGDRVKILDFGIALFVSERRLTWQGLSSTIGTPDYMAPEQIRGRRGDPRTDVFAVGTLLYEMLTCHLPWDSPNPRALLKSKVNEDAKPPSYWVPGFDPSLEAIILRALERDPRDRYGSAKQLLGALEDPSAVPLRDPQTGARRRARKPLSRRVRLQVALLAVIAALVSLVWLTKRTAVHAERPAPPPARQGR